MLIKNILVLDIVYIVMLISCLVVNVDHIRALVYGLLVLAKPNRFEKIHYFVNVNKGWQGVFLFLFYYLSTLTFFPVLD